MSRVLCFIFLVVVAGFAGNHHQEWYFIFLAGDIFAPYGQKHLRRIENTRRAKVQN
jgi:hypothetical protein